MTLGMIINELVSNALKHAFPISDSGRRQTGQIDIQLRADEEQQWLLVVSDNGVGLPAEIDIKTPQTLGLQLVRSLIMHINGAIEVNRDAGTVFKIRFAPLLTEGSVTFG